MFKFFPGLAALMLFAAIIVCGTRLPLKSYTTSEGLPHDRVNRIVRDSRGFLWFCTSEGLARFDGSEFKRYGQDDGLPHRSIMDLLETRDGKLWIGTGDGLVLFEPSNGRSGPGMFRIFRDGDSKHLFTVADLIEDRMGRIWAATKIGLYRLDPDSGDWRMERIDTSSWKTGDSIDFTSLREDRRGAIWVGAERGLYRLLPDGSAQVLDPALRVNFGTILEDRNGRVWVGTGGEAYGLYQYVFPEGSNEPPRPRIFTTDDGLDTATWMNALFETSDGRILVGVDKALCEFVPDSPGKLFKTVLRANMLSIGEDVGGNLWLGTSSAGALRLAQGGFIAFDESDGLKVKRVASIINGSDGETYVMAGAGVIHRFDENRFAQVAPTKMALINWSANQVTFQDHNGEWWVSSYYGLQRYPRTSRLEDLAHTAPIRNYTKADGLSSNAIFQLFEDSRGDIWIGMLDNNLINTVARWERATDTIHPYFTENGFPPGNTPTALGEDKAGNVWLGFYGSGLGRVRGENLEMYGVEDGMPNGFVRDMHTDRSGRLWIATTSGGVVRIDDPTVEKPALVNLRTSNGLASNQANCVAEDNFGHIYIGTGRGVNQIDMQSARIRRFTKTDGLPENLVSLCQADEKGAVWFATAEGLARYFPTEEQISPSPPIFIDAVRVNGEMARKLSELGETTVEKLDFPTDERQIQIGFFSLGFSVGEDLHYQYKIGDSDWSEPLTQRTVNLNLAPGAYTFSVRAVNSVGAVSETPARVLFTIAHPIWQRWWFLTLLALVLAGVVYMTYRYRLRRLLEIERVRTRIATDLHDDIGASLSEIAILSEIVWHRVAPAAEATNTEITKPLGRIAGTSRKLVDSMSDIVWAINPQKDHLTDLISRMRNLAGEMTGHRDIRLKVNLSGMENKDLALGTDLRREVYLIFKETVNNLLKHSECDTAEVEFRLAGDDLIISVSDNGKGFDDSTNGNGTNLGGNGLPNMKRRASNFGGNYRISSEIGKGTTAVLRIPLKNGKMSIKKFFRNGN